MVQHIGRRLTLKQSANNTFIIGGGWPAHPERAAGALLDALGERRRQRCGRGARRAGARRRAASSAPGPGVMAFTDDLSPVVGESSRRAGLLHVHRDDRVHADPVDRAAPGRAHGDEAPRFRQRSPPTELRPVNRRPPEERTRWTATTSPGRATGPPARLRSAPTARYDPDAHRALLELYLGSGVHGVLINGTTGEWFSQTPDERRLVAETAIDAVAGRVPVVVGVAPLHGARGGRARTARDRRRRRGDRVDAAAVREDVRPRDRRLLRGPRRAASTGRCSSTTGCTAPRVDIGPELADRLVEIDTVVALKDSTPNVEQFYETTRTVVDRVRVFGPFMSRRGLRAADRRRRRRLHRRRLALRRRRRGVLGELLARRRSTRAARTPSASTGCSRSSGCPGGWGGVYGGYQSQLKAIMKLLGQPGGEPRRPRLPRRRPGEPRCDRARSCVRSRCCRRRSGAA